MMKKLKNKTKTATIALILILTISAILVALPAVTAHDPGWKIPTYAYVSVSNSVIGVGQQLTIVFWSSFVPPTAAGMFGDRWIFTINVTKPDGTTETLGPITSDPIGGGYVPYAPDQLGTYTVVAHQMEHLITGEPKAPMELAAREWRTAGVYEAAYIFVNDTALASTSEPVTFTAQQEPIQEWQEAPLTTQYWTRPINSMNRNWYVLAGNWLAGVAQNVGPTTKFAYGLGPQSSHIMWVTPMWDGGITDARLGNLPYKTQDYEGLALTPPIILNGRIYYNVQSNPRMGWYCLDLYTGETQYFHNTTGDLVGYNSESHGSIRGESLAFGQILNFDTPNQHGAIPYLWSKNGPNNTWEMFDAFTGNYICSIANVTQIETRGSARVTTGATGTNVYSKDGSILYYNIVNFGTTTSPKCYLQVWNTTQAINWIGTSAMFLAGDYSLYPRNDYWKWRPGRGITYDGNNGFTLNASIPDVKGTVLAVREGQYVIGGIAGYHNSTYTEKGHLWALSLKLGQEGTLLWNTTFTPPPTGNDLAKFNQPGVYSNYGIRPTMSGPFVDPEDGVFLFKDQIQRLTWCYSLVTGQLLWTSESEPQMNFYRSNENIYQGMLFTSGIGGELIAYNITTGEVLWTYTAEQVGFESPYGDYPIGIAVIADGKLYCTSAEHTTTQPPWRGSYLRCINASNGAELWKINMFGMGSNEGNGAVAADGYIIGLNQYDNQIYSFGKGPSETTVSAPTTTIPRGEAVLITGTVMDIAPGTQQLEQSKRFPNGVPAVSDASQENWMEYVYMQQGCPADAEGVEVVITTLDPNGNTYEIGRTTTSLSGTFGCAVNPPVPGLYKIIATFQGSNSYYRSYTETYINVGEAPKAATPIEPEPTQPAPTEPTPTEPEPTTPELTEPTSTEPTEAPFITTEVAIIAAVVLASIIGIVSFWALRKRK